ncbi:GPW/gp25 family protein [Cystobacter ferrugineus]|uniref:GPW/gp25 family protein n=1 Tax=Cystobacter ferrugineus TaxID=83449 RepID=UPI0009FCA4F9|nr:GPW/gp25 family protein [Cystobacter ferrugineus]
MADRFLYHPFRFGAQGGVAVTEDPDRHLRDKVEAVLFTAPGERVNQPDFGAGLNRAVFETLDELSIAALEFRVSQALRRDIGEEIIIDSVDFEPEPEAGELVLHIAFRRRSDQRPRSLEVRL